MSNRNKKMALGAFLRTDGHHIAGWRHPDAQADAGVNFSHYKRMAEAVERGKMDFLFLADTMGVADLGESGTHTSRVDSFEPFTLLGALSTVTKNCGLVLTASTTYYEPYHIARKLASLDHLTGGRAAWNLVTSWTETEALNFNFDKRPAHDNRYDRAEEFIDVVLKLWDSWGDDALPRNKETGIYWRQDGLNLPNHKGKNFSVRGPLNAARPVQGHPVVVQAGSSGNGRKLAARTAEVIFTAQTNLPGAQKFYADVKGQMQEFGRSPDDLKIMPGVFVIVGETESHAKEKFEQLQSLVDEVVGRAILTGMSLNMDISHLPLDAPFPETAPLTEGSKSRQQLLFELAHREKLTIRQAYLRFAGASGHLQLIGTAKQIADQFEEWFQAEGCDGFNVCPAILPTELEMFVDNVIPELQRRGLFRTEYTGRTLRENLGLKRPGRV